MISILLGTASIVGLVYILFGVAGWVMGAVPAKHILLWRPYFTGDIDNHSRLE